MDDKKKKIFCGSVAGLFEAMIMQPLDTIKVLKQSNQYNGFYATLRNEGILRFYKGLTPFMGQMTVKYGLRFSVFEFLRGKDNNPLRNFGSGLVAGFAESLFITPFELIKTNLQTTKNNNPLKAITNIYAENGVRSLYRGFATTCFRQSINQATNFTVYHEIRKKIIKENEQPNFLKFGLAGMISGSIGPSLNNPFDVVKTRYMNPFYNKKYNSIPHALVTIIKEEGFGALYRGLGLRIIRVSGGQGIVFSVVELMMFYCFSKDKEKKF